MDVSHSLLIHTPPSRSSFKLLPQAPEGNAWTLTPYSTSSTTRSKLVVSGDQEEFASGISNFSEIREPRLAYFHKTEYIPMLEKRSKVQLVCRPRWFGKSLTVSMQQYFHGVQFRSQYDELFKVCGILLVQDSPAHNHWYWKLVSTWMKLARIQRR